MFWMFVQKSIENNWHSQVAVSTHSREPAATLKKKASCCRKKAHAHLLFFCCCSVSFSLSVHRRWQIRCNICMRKPLDEWKRREKKWSKLMMRYHSFENFVCSSHNAHIPTHTHTHKHVHVALSLLIFS
jgi:hypothetical protein